MKLNLDVQLTLPEKGVGWIARVEVFGASRVRIGVSEDRDVGEALKGAILIATAANCDPESNHIS